MYLSWFLFFVAGIIFSKLATGFLDIGITANFARNISDRIILSLVLIAQELEYLRQLRLQVLKDKGLDEKDIDFQMEMFDSWFTKWKESIIISFISSYPKPLKSELEFHDWKSVTVYVQKIIKQKRI